MLEVGTSVIMRFEMNVGTLGNGPVYRRLQLQDADTQEVILAYAWGYYPASYDDFLQPEEVMGICPTTCQSVFEGSASSAVRFSDGMDSLTLFEGQSGMLGPYMIWVTDAVHYQHCFTDTASGHFDYLVVKTG